MKWQDWVKHDVFDRTYLSPSSRMHAAACEQSLVRCKTCQGWVEIFFDDYRRCWTLGDDTACTCDGGYSPYAEGITVLFYGRPCYVVEREEVFAEMLGEMDRVLGR